MKKKMLLMALAAFIVLSASAMIMRLTYIRVSDKDCGNKCVISNADQGITRKCGKCGEGFLNGGKATIVEGDWWQAIFTCNKCGHQSVWKYKEK